MSKDMGETNRQRIIIQKAQLRMLQGKSKSKATDYIFHKSELCIWTKHDLQRYEKWNGENV